MHRDEILAWLIEEDPARLEMLWARADAARQNSVGDAVHIRGLIEFSNYCRSNCLYCGMRSVRSSLPRYRMTRDDILAAAEEAAARGYGTVVMQSGEDPALDVEWLAGIIRTIKSTLSLCVTLSCGERSVDELAHLRGAGADRYYLRFETSDRKLWKRIHPAAGDRLPHRLDLLPLIKNLGYETGSGIMVGIPGQTWTSLADDIEWFGRLDLDMIGCGPYVPHPDTPSGEIYGGLSPRSRDQTPNTNLLVYRVMALTRLMCPNSNIPSTTAIATLNRENGHYFGLQRGANVLMVNLTPLKYRRLYEIYPEKAGIHEFPCAQRERIASLLSGLGRRAGEGPGTSLHFKARRKIAGPETAGSGTAIFS
jgi:biotin synthase